MDIRIFFISLIFILFSLSCDNDRKLTSYFNPGKEVILKKQSDQFIQDISFLFVVDTSGSMSKLRETLAENITLFLNPIFSNYPYYNYNFAITTMSKAHDFRIAWGGDDKKRKLPLYLTEDYDECKSHVEPSLFFSKTKNIGDYLHYSINDLKKYSHEDLVCILAQNIQKAKGFEGGKESFFQSISFIIRNSDPEFMSQFFGKDKMLALFFISDAFEGVDFDAQKKAGILNADEIIAKERLDLIQSVMGSYLNIRSYAVVLDNRRKDRCGSEGGAGLTPSAYPFHLYRFIEKTNGLRISICDGLWGDRLTDVFYNLRETFHSTTLYLDEVPKLDTLEVFLNDKEIPKDMEKGWYFKPENLSINLGSDFNFMPYMVDKKEKSIDNEFTIKYIPLNIELLY